MALPSLSPLGRLLPAPFGRDWALLPPAYSLRAELKALYAAVLRTFCLNAETIRALCQWDSLRKPPVASSSFASPATSTTVFDAPADESLRMSAEAAAFSPVGAPSVPASPRGGSMHWGALAGGACALGGAAMLAWVAFDHLTQRQATSDARLAANAPVRQEAQLANRHSPDAAVTPYADASNRAAAPASGAALLPVDMASVAGAGASVSASAAASPDTSSQALAATRRRDFTASPATEIVATVKAAPPHATAGRNVSRRRDRLRENAPSRDERSGRSSQAIVATQVSPQLPSISSTNYETPQITVPANAQRTSPKPSSAGPYSPLAPSQLGTDEYASMTMSAGTHLRNIAPPSRPASSINAPENGGTEWVNQMSHRRVTEVPDQFVK